jgi:hypothetical protein
VAGTPILDRKKKEKKKKSLSNFKRDGKTPVLLIQIRFCFRAAVGLYARNLKLVQLNPGLDSDHIINFAPQPTTDSPVSVCCQPPLIKIMLLQKSIDFWLQCVWA